MGGICVEASLSSLLCFYGFPISIKKVGVSIGRKLQEQKVIETSVHNFQLGPFELNVPGESYVILEYFHGSDIVPNTTASYIFLFIMVISAVVMLTVITTLDKFWYYVGMGVFILFLVSLRLEVLGIFSQYNRGPVIVALILFVVPAFYFNRFRPSFPFRTRFLVFLLLTIVVGFIINYFSSVALPLTILPSPGT